MVRLKVLGIFGFGRGVPMLPRCHIGAPEALRPSWSVVLTRWYRLVLITLRSARLLDTVSRPMLHSTIWGRATSAHDRHSPPGEPVLSARKSRILNLLIGDYIRQATPIASESIARHGDLGVSPATIRNDVVELEQEDYITRPHTSAGSVPSDKGYRFYVESMMPSDLIPPEIQESIRARLADAERDLDDWTRVGAAILASLVGNLAIATFPKAPESRVKRVELVGLQDFLALMIVVFEQARLRRHLIRLQERQEPADLQESANKLSHILKGRTWQETESIDPELSPLEEEMFSSAVLMLKEEDRTDYRDHYLDGLRNLVRQPEFAEGDQVQTLVGAVEDGTLARAILDETPNRGVVRVVIGEEAQGDMLRPLSVVIGRYGVPGEAAGAVGAIGPVRMEYAKAIAGVELMASVMRSMVESVPSR